MPALMYVRDDVVLVLLGYHSTSTVNNGEIGDIAAKA